MKHSSYGFLTSAVAATLLASASAGAFERTERRANCADYRTERQVLWGDLHVHTTLSLDARIQNTQNRPADAYRFAKGERIGFQPYDHRGQPMRHWKLARPLDFTAITDHAETMGEAHICSTPGAEGYSSITCRIARSMPSLGLLFLMQQVTKPNNDRFGFCGENGQKCLDAAGGPWQEIQRAAEAAYDRSAKCEFTSLIGYEWTGRDDVNLHRNVIFRNEKAPALPISHYEIPDQDEMLRVLDAECRDLGCEAMVIPHNSNLSRGVMFGDPWSQPRDAEWARYRQMEGLFELLQHKGASECWYEPGAADELCAFEKLPYNTFRGRFFAAARGEYTRPSYGFARQTLGFGMIHAERLGVNPHRFGFIGSTDTHLGTPGLVAESADYPGHGGAGFGSAKKVPKGLSDAIEYNPGALAAVWAEENSRDSIFAAMRRRETYATSGPRIRLRFFAGYGYDADLCAGENLVAEGYAGGVPMGGEIAARDGAPLMFIVEALRDTGVGPNPGTPLQHVQIIKQTLDAAGEIHERIYEVAGDPDNGASVDPGTCAPRGPGADRLCAVWRDPDYDPDLRAYYYARALENPTCRWSQRLCLAEGVDCDNPRTIGDGLEDCCSPEHRPIIKERAVSSPIWHLPEGKSN